MVGWIQWAAPEGRRVRSVTLSECTVFHMRLLRAQVPRKEGERPAAVRRRIARAARALAERGVDRVLLPEDVTDASLPRRWALESVSTLPLRRALASAWVEAALADRPDRRDLKVAVSARRFTGEVARAVKELALRYRYVLLDTPYGAEELSRELRRTYGIALMTSPTREQCAAADAWVLFDPPAERGRGVTIPLWDETVELPALLLPPALEEQIPPGIDRVRLLTLLVEAGILRPGQITLGAG